MPLRQAVSLLSVRIVKREAKMLMHSLNIHAPDCADGCRGLNLTFQVEKTAVSPRLPAVIIFDSSRVVRSNLMLAVYLINLHTARQKAICKLC